MEHVLDPYPINTNSCRWGQPDEGLVCVSLINRQWTSLISNDSLLRFQNSQLPFLASAKS